MFIRYIYNIDTKFHRLIEQLFFVKEKLKIAVFEKKILISRLENQIKFFSLLFFVDVFKLYRNMYRNLIKIYVFSADLNVAKRQKNKNCHVFIFEPHEINFNDIINIF